MDCVAPDHKVSSKARPLLVFNVASGEGLLQAALESLFWSPSLMVASILGILVPIFPYVLNELERKATRRVKKPLSMDWPA